MQDHSDDAVIEAPADLTADRLSATLRAGTVTGFRSERIGTGQVSDCYRVSVDYAPGASGPRTVILKVAAGDPTSRRTGIALGLYECEVRFYRELAPHLAAGPIPVCYHAAFDSATGAFDLLIGDAVASAPGDEIRGATIEQARLAVGELGRLHAIVLEHPGLTDADWLDRGSMLNQDLLAQLYTMFLDRYGEHLTAPQRSVCDAVVGSFDSYRSARTTFPIGLVHADYRLDNLLFGSPDAERPLTVVDWQGVMRGPVMSDLANFLGGAMSIEDRRAHYDELIDLYRTSVGPDSPYTDAQIRETIRYQSFTGVITAIAASMVVERTDRGDRLFMTTLHRHCAHVLDIGALELLAPAATA
ncbi:ecdysteroid 22-kinase family protein [Nocardia sp. alder85J]|uniref:ecdysteroid 22-kinase family protein n=1 Tax=Nocardia sp. alder85J TaxID=2862949 RepID=UPI001CD4C1DF|nr:ecdysteroid 22-kinase family protein [Nocardia sp. alder85J]MCX4096795.1 phosphotransferase [Nocardia sp. alder85J]